MGKLNRIIPLCACGCLKHVVWNKWQKCWNKFIHGHNQKGKINIYKGTGKQLSLPQLCACGCLEMTKPGNKFIHGHNRKGAYHTEKTRQRMQGRKCSLETIEKIRQSHIGQLNSEESIKKQVLSVIEFYKDPANRKKHSEKMKEVCKLDPTIGQRASERMKGPGSPLYVDGRCSGENYEYSEKWVERLRELVRDRDDRRCRLCSIPEEELGQKLDVHHIDYNKKSIDLDNLISLCHPCHGKTNIHRDKWISFFKGKQRISMIAGAQL